jgi:hypothetical protein
VQSQQRSCRLVKHRSGGSEQHGPGGDPVGLWCTGLAGLRSVGPQISCGPVDCSPGGSEEQGARGAEILQPMEQ